MEEMEVPTEHLHEEINERAKEEKNWSLYVAVSTALMAALAAVASMLAGHDSNEALIEQIKASDQWAYYQAKGIKQEIAKLGTVTDTVKIARYQKEQLESKRAAEEDERKSKTFLEQHVFFARCVTLFQIAIAISAVSIITRRRPLWYLALLIAVVGLYIFVTSLW